MMYSMKLLRAPEINTVLFDLGGVLAGDVLEGILFHRTHGLAPRGWQARRRWARAAWMSWKMAAIRTDVTREEFWAAFSHNLGQTITPEAAMAAEAKTLRADPSAAHLIAQLTAAGVRVGIVSDNTPFFCADQLSALALTAPLDQNLMFLSYARGTTKRRGLYRLAAEYVSAPHTLVIEDRLLLRRSARAAGFRVARYHFGNPSALHRTLKGHKLLP
jgi:phosphoglycolate phosphatase-like HAD superfamily hydrolase